MANETTQPTSGLDAYHFEIEKSLVQRIAELERERDELKAHCNRYEAVFIEVVIPHVGSIWDKISDYSIAKVDYVLNNVPSQSLAEHDAKVIEEFMNGHCTYLGGSYRTASKQDLQDYANNLRQKKDK